VLQIGGLPRGVGEMGELGIEAGPGAKKERDTNVQLDFLMSTLECIDLL
jgi:hypothetical protein